MSKHLTDKQSEPDHRELPIDKVGVRGLRYPIQVRDKSTDSLQSTVATVGLFVDLPKEFKGTHMSRFVEVLNAHGSVIHVKNIPDILSAMQKRLHAQNAHLEMEFPFFLTKK
ncbi:MAG: GTP cyclohydrolase, FolE2/MptA family, partial [Verrucomicrobiota bacterium]